MIPTLSDALAKPLTPLIRARFQEGVFGANTTVIGITENGVCTGRMRRGASFVDVVDDATLKQSLNCIKELPFQDVTSVNLWRGGKRTQLAKLRINSPARTLRMRLPHSEAEHFLGLLQARLDDPIALKRAVPLHGLGMNLVLLFALAMTAGMMVALRDWMIGATIVVVTAVPLLVVQIHDHLPAWFPWEAANQTNRNPVQNRSGAEPFRSKLLGWALKIGCVLVLIVLWSTGLMLLAPFALLLLYIGNQIASIPPRLVRESDPRAPILYLRSFLDDRKSTLTPDTWYAIVMGVMPPRFLPTPWRYLLYFHPVRVLRILVGASVDTSEEQLALFFRQHGPFVAIGMPGERFATPGASRMYVSNNEWQKVVLEHLKTSQIVLLQPAQTEGIWWEVEKTLSQVDPRRILLCMVNFHRLQNEYEKFRLRVEPFLKHPLPRYLAYTRTASFIYFDADGNPSVQEASCRAPAVWPVVGNAVDLTYTLQPFLNSAKTAGTPCLQEAFASEATPELTESPDQATVTTSPATVVSPAAQRDLGTLPREPRGISRGARFVGGLAYLGGVLAFLGVSALNSTDEQAASTAGVANDGRGLARGSISTPMDVGSNAGQVVDGAALDEVVELKRRGVALYRDGKFELALSALDQAVALDDADPQSLLFRGDALESLQRPDEAIADYERALAIDPNYAPAWNNLGYAHLQTGRYDDAVKYFTEAMKRKPEDASLLANRGIAYLFGDQPDAAIADFTRSLQLDAQQPRVYYYQGKALAKKQQWISAIQHFNTSVQLDPEDLDNYRERAAAFVAIGGQKSPDFNPYDFARRDLHEYRKRSRDDPEILLELAEVNRLDGNFNPAIAEVSEFLKEVPDHENALVQRANLLLEANRRAEAVADAEKLVRLHPDDVGKQVFLASVLFRTARYQEAISQADAAIARRPEEVAAYLIRGNSLYRQRSYDRALESFADALKLQSQDPVALANRAQIFAIQNRYDLCAAEYQKLVEVQSDQFDPAFFLCLAFAAAKQWDRFADARSSLTQAFGNVRNPQIQVLILRLALLGPDRPPTDWAEAKRVVDSLHQTHPDNRDFDLLRAAIAIRLGQFASAEAVLRSTLAEVTEPGRIAVAQLWMSQTQVGLGNTEAAKGMFDSASTWVRKYSSLDMVQEELEHVGEPANRNDGFQWWQRVEIQEWLAMTDDALNSLPSRSPSAPSELR